MNYEEMKNTVPRELAHENHDCTVKAVALACNIPYAKVHAALKRCGRQDGRGAHMNQVQDALRLLGFSFERVDCHGPMLWMLAQKNYYVNGVTPSQIKNHPDLLAGLPNGILEMQRHVAALVDGVVEDWTAGRRHRIQRFFAVWPKNEPRPEGIDRWKARRPDVHFHVHVLNKDSYEISRYDRRGALSKSESIGYVCQIGKGLWKCRDYEAKEVLEFPTRNKALNYLMRK